MMFIRRWTLVLLLLLSLKTIYSQGNNRVVERENEALRQSFVGVTSDGHAIPGLFHIRSTGVNTGPIRHAAGGFIESLTDLQKANTQFSIDDQEWHRWSNIDKGSYRRQGVNLKEMTAAQRKSAWNLLTASLSERGVQLSRDIMKTDHTLREINNDSLRYDEQFYYFTMMGVPSPAEPWGWQLDGHHLVINYFLLGDQVVMSPVFLGGEPVRTTSGKYAGNVILQEEQDRGLSLMQSLNGSQRARALLSSDKAGNNVKARANRDNVVMPFEGINVGSFSQDQKARLIELIALFVGNMREGHAKVRMAEIQEHLGDTWFSWIGAVTDDAVFYYRIHSPVILIEFDHQRPVGTRRLNNTRQPSRDHIHVVIRTPNGNDYGKDLLRQHLEQHGH